MDQGDAVPLVADPLSEAEKEKRRQLYMAEAKKQKDEYKKLLGDPRWKRVDYNGGHGISAYEMEADGNCYYLKAEGVVDSKSADSIARAHRDCNHSSRTQWDGANIHDIGLLEDIVHMHGQHGHEIFLNVQFAEHVSRIPGVSAREFVYIEWSWKKPSQVNPEDHHWTILAAHTDHYKKPRRETPVRALQRTIMILEPREPIPDEALGAIPRTSVTIVAWVDPGGYITPAVAKLYRTILADRIAMLRTVHFV